MVAAAAPPATMERTPPPVYRTSCEFGGALRAGRASGRGRGVDRCCRGLPPRLFRGGEFAREEDEEEDEEEGWRRRRFQVPIEASPPEVSFKFTSLFLSAARNSAMKSSVGGMAGAKVGSALGRSVECALGCTVGCDVGRRLLLPPLC